MSFLEKRGKGHGFRFRFLFPEGKREKLHGAFSWTKKRQKLSSREREPVFLMGLQEVNIHS